MKWISVKDELPNPQDHGMVIVSGIEDGERFVYWAEVRSYGDRLFNVPGWSAINEETTHWMPLPEPPKENN